MSAPLIELRFGIPESTDAAIESESKAFGKDKNAFAREIIMDWHRRFHRAHKLYGRKIADNGLQAELPGFEPEDDGIARKGRR